MESLKIIILGEIDEGKTSLITQFIDKTFEEDSKSINGGILFQTKTLIYDNNKGLKFEIWDIAGQVKYHN